MRGSNVHILECRDSADPKVWASVRNQRVISLSTKHRIRATLRSALSDAVRSPEEPVNINAASHSRLPSCPRKKPLVWTPGRVRQWEKDGSVLGEVMVWTPEQTRTFLAHARKYVWLHPLFHLIAVKGLCRGEAVGLPWQVLFDEPGEAQPTLKAREDAALADRDAAVRADPLVAAAMAAFPDAELAEIRSNA